MIIGENRAKVIENIKAAVKKGKMHAKVELGDPILTKSERIKLVNDYWEQQKKFSHKLKNIIAQGIINIDTLILMAHTRKSRINIVLKGLNMAQLLLVITSNKLIVFQSKN